MIIGNQSKLIASHTQTVSHPKIITPALLDTGSSINLMSYFLYNSLSKKYKSELLTVTNNKIILANNQGIQKQN
jgi:hypothetical protein